MAIARPSRPFHWPGGIPPEVRVDANGDITEQEAAEEAKGWLLFVEEQWVPRAAANIPNEDGDYEVRQRRALVEKWAKATQEFRDSYHNRAPLRKALDYPKEVLDGIHHCFNSPSFMCLPPLGPSYRSNRAKWIKMCILAYRLDGEMGHCLGEYGSDPAPGGIDVNPVTFPDPSTAQITDVLPRAVLEMANLSLMTMTRRGTVLFMKEIPYWFLVTADDLDTGHITIVEFKPNGQIRESCRRRVINMWPVYLEYCVQRRSLKTINHDDVGGMRIANSDLDMTQPVIDILEGTRARGEFVFGMDGGRDGWTEDIEIYAPGYLEIETAGNEADYDPARLVDPDDAYGIRERKYVEEIMRERQMGGENGYK